MAIGQVSAGQVQRQRQVAQQLTYGVGRGGHLPVVQQRFHGCLRLTGAASQQQPPAIGPGQGVQRQALHCRQRRPVVAAGGDEHTTAPRCELPVSHHPRVVGIVEDEQAGQRLLPLLAHPSYLLGLLLREGVQVHAAGAATGRHLGSDGLRVLHVQPEDAAGVADTVTMRVLGGQLRLADAAQARGRRHLPDGCHHPLSIQQPGQSAQLLLPAGEVKVGPDGHDGTGRQRAHRRDGVGVNLHRAAGEIVGWDAPHAAAQAVESGRVFQAGPEVHPGAAAEKEGQRIGVGGVGAGQQHRDDVAAALLHGGLQGHEHPRVLPGATALGTEEDGTGL